MTDIEKWAPPGTDLIKFAEEASQIHTIAKGLAGTSFVPKAFQGRPDEITGAILAGRELNLPPMTALRAINLINGTPALEANAQRGLAIAAGIEFDLVESTATRCVMRAKPKDRDRWTEVTWDIDRAQRMGLTGKDNWKKQPQSMLIARATSELCRLEAAHVLYGMPYSQEELKDGTDSITEPPPVAATPKLAATRTAQREPGWKDLGYTDGGKVYLAPVGTPPPPSRAVTTVATTLDAEIIGDTDDGGTPVPVPPPPPPPKPRGPGTARRPPMPGEDDPPPQPTAAMQETQMRRPGQRNGGNEITTNTRKALMATFNEIGVRTHADRVERIQLVLNDPNLYSSNQLTEDEAKYLIHALRNGIVHQPKPPAGYDPWAGIEIKEPAS